MEYNTSLPEKTLRSPVGHHCPDSVLLVGRNSITLKMFQEYNDELILTG